MAKARASARARARGSTMSTKTTYHKKFTTEMTHVTDLEPVGSWEDESIAFNIKVTLTFESPHH